MMRAKWRAGLVFCVLLSNWCNNVSAAQDDNHSDNLDDEYSEKYDDWTDRFDDIFKRIDEYDDDFSEKINHKDIYNNRDSNEKTQASEPHEIVNTKEVHDLELQVEDIRYESFQKQGNEFANQNKKQSHDKNDEKATYDYDIGDKGMNGNAPINDYDPLEEFEEDDDIEDDSRSNNLHIEENQVEDKIQNNTNYNYFKESLYPSNVIIKSNGDDIGDKNMNENAPMNDNRPLKDTEDQLEENSDSSSVQIEESPVEDKIQNNINYFKESPYVSKVNFENNIDTLEKADKSNDQENSKTVEDINLGKIFQETEDILQNDSDGNDFAVGTNVNIDQVDQNVPDNIMQETQKILKETSEASNDFVDLEKDISVDKIYDDINADLAKLYETLDKLKSYEDDIDENDQNYRNDEDWRQLNSDWEKSNEGESESLQQENDQAKSESVVGNQDSSENERQELDQLNEMLKKQLIELENLNFDGDSYQEEDYQDSYDDEIKESDIDDHKYRNQENNNAGAIPYGDDAISKDEVEEEKYKKSGELMNNIEITLDVNEEKDIIINDDIRELETPLSKDAIVNSNFQQKLNSSFEENREESVETLGNKLKEEVVFNEENFDQIDRFRELHQTDIEMEAASSDIPARHIQISVEESQVVTSQDYPSPYPAGAITDWYFDGEGGAGIEFNITDLFVNGDAGDYLLIKPGGTGASGSDGIIFSYQLKQERNYRFFDVDTLYVRFESKATTNTMYRGFQFSVKFIDSTIERVAVPEPEPEPAAAEPAETMTLYLSGVTPLQFKNISEPFRQILLDMTTMYLNEEGIHPGVLPLSDVVQLTRVAVCNINWPYHDSCSAVTFGVPLYYNTTDDADEDLDDEYLLSKEQLTSMWRKYSGLHPFAVRLSLLGITEYGVPDARAATAAWWLLSLGVALLVLLLGFTLYRWNCFDDYTGMTRLSETDSMASNRKSDLSLYPTPHQDIPPMFAAGGQYDGYLDGDLPPKYDDTTRVELGGAGGARGAGAGGAFQNKSFVRDGELFDLDSDEEIIMSLPDENKSENRNSVIRPRDIYDV